MNPTAQATARPVRTAIDLDTLIQLGLAGVNLRDHVLECLFGRSPRPAHPVITSDLSPLGYAVGNVRMTFPCVVFSVEVAA